MMKVRTLGLVSIFALSTFLGASWGSKLKSVYNKVSGSASSAAASVSPEQVKASIEAQMHKSDAELSAMGKAMVSAAANITASGFSGTPTAISAHIAAFDSTAEDMSSSVTSVADVLKNVQDPSLEFVENQAKGKTTCTCLHVDWPNKKNISTLKSLTQKKQRGLNVEDTCAANCKQRGMMAITQKDFCSTCVDAIKEALPKAHAALEAEAKKIDAAWESFATDQANFVKLTNSIETYISSVGPLMDGMNMALGEHGRNCNPSITASALFGALGQLQSSKTVGGLRTSDQLALLRSAINNATSTFVEIGLLKESTANALMNAVAPMNKALVFDSGSTLYIAEVPAALQKAHGALVDATNTVAQAAEQLHQSRTELAEQFANKQICGKFYTEKQLETDFGTDVEAVDAPKYSDSSYAKGKYALVTSFPQLSKIVAWKKKQSANVETAERSARCGIIPEREWREEHGSRQRHAHRRRRGPFGRR